MERVDQYACGQDPEMAPETSRSGNTLGLLLVVAAVLILASLVLPRHKAFNPGYADMWLRLTQDVGYDALRLVGVTCVAIVVAAYWPTPWLKIEQIVFRSRLWRFLLVCFIISVATSALYSWFVFDGLPHIPDEIAMLFQAKVLAAGKLFAQAPPMPEFFDWESIIVDGPKWYGKYFVGQSAVLVPGLWLDIPWMIHPLLVVPALWLTYLLGVEILNETIARVAVLVMTLSPFRMVIFALLLAHPVTLVAMALFVLGVLRMVKDPTRWGWSLMAGIGFGVGWNSRPYTAAAMALPLLVMAFAKLPWRRLTLKTVLAFTITVGLGFVLYLGYNKALTGSALDPPFHVWSKTDRLGFGPDRGLEYWRPQDRGHSLAKGLFKDVFFNLDALADQLTMLGRGSLPILLIPLFWSPWPRRTWLVASIPLCVAIAYVFHVTHSVLAGQPRYWSETMPMIVLLAAIGLAAVRRFLPIVCRRLGIQSPVRTGRAACWLTVSALTVFGVGSYVFDALTIEPHTLWEQAADIREVANREKMDNALVFVKSVGYYRAVGKTLFGIDDKYAAAFMLNDPMLSGPVVYARDLGRAKNIELARYFPGRQLYWIDPMEVKFKGFIPMERVQTSSAP